MRPPRDSPQDYPQDYPQDLSGVFGRGEPAGDFCHTCFAPMIPGPSPGGRAGPAFTEVFFMFSLSDPRLKKAEEIFFIAVVTVLAVFLRVSLFDFESGDYRQFLQGWYSVIKENDGLAAVGMDIGDYMPPYFYLLALAAYLPIRDLFAIKLISCAADFVLAFFAGRIVSLRYPGRPYGLLAYGVILFCPTVILNSAVWGQCDAIFTAALAASLYYCMTGKDIKAVVSFGIAFVFKLQAVFFAPFLAVLVLRRHIRLRALLAFPAVYLISILPAALAGRSFSDLLTVYFRQAGQYSMISMYATNLYTWIPTDYSEYLGTPLVIFALGGVFMAAACLYRKSYRMTGEIALSSALFFLMLVPFLLPHMHERYFFPADVMSVVFAFFFPRRLYVPGVMLAASTVAVCHNLFGTEFMQVEIISAAVGAVLVYVGVHTARLILASPADGSSDVLPAPLPIRTAPARAAGEEK